MGSLTWSGTVYEELEDDRIFAAKDDYDDEDDDDYDDDDYDDEDDDEDYDDEDDE